MLFRLFTLLYLIIYLKINLLTLGLTAMGFLLLRYSVVYTVECLSLFYPLFISRFVWLFQTMHCPNFNTQRQKRHNVIYNVKVHFLICGFAGCVTNMLFLANILFYPYDLCYGIRKKVGTDSFLPKVCFI